ncbi:hypothetical protein [Pseudoxanthomonas sp.]|uniref:hypothetical protein n=1 Tax=Pseudoxanthomonas sp. TaxID=1871049 RepID=UPI002603C63C|nr:hypothetical protein [Pseudoxanthomonas sp.]WDS35377.1 MAG: hypothetical protein O8I58_13615 [Pseudoxanthomonas sp.]
MERVFLAVGCCIALSVSASPATAHEKLAADYEAGHFFITLNSSEGQRLRLVVDSGGGGGIGRFILTPAAVVREHLATRTCGTGDEASIVVDLPAPKWKGLPVVEHRGCDAMALVPDGYTELGDADGNLGAGYLPHFTWTFDYPAKTLWRESSNWKAASQLRPLHMSFPKNAAGDRWSGLPRITLNIAGQPLDFLLDTGATAKPTPAGLEASHIDTARGIGVTSYITTSMLERWHREHQTWRLVDKGDALMDGMRIIEVPSVEIAGWSVGPLWFTERPDGAFDEHTGISQYMDGPVVGAAGANLWQNFVMTLDYSHDTAWLACADCKSSVGTP